MTTATQWSFESGDCDHSHLESVNFIDMSPNTRTETTGEHLLVLGLLLGIHLA